MIEKKIRSLLRAEVIEFPPVTPDIPHGDMPGDRLVIGEDHIKKAEVLFPLLLQEMERLTRSGQKKIVVCVCGGSGVGKSEIASILAFWLNSSGIGTYVLSGDNYPRRFPALNDAERLRCFRSAGVRGMVQEGKAGRQDFAALRRMQEQFVDADPACAREHPWFACYLRSGRRGLEQYLGTRSEICFEEVAEVLRQFHGGQADIWLRRLGRTDNALWYDCIDFSEKEVLILEWTHGNSDAFQGVDIPIFLNSTPQETLAHRRARNRDGKSDSAFTTLVLQIEQGLLAGQAHKAKIILAKSGEVLPYPKYKERMEGEGDE